MDTRLDQVVVRLSDTQQITLAELLGAWRAHVERIHSEQDLDPGTGWTAHDLVAALLLRDRIEDALKGQSAALRSEADESLIGVDSMFSELTVADPDGFVCKFAGEPDASGWWWFRLPRSGPIRADLDDWQEKLPG